MPHFVLSRKSPHQNPKTRDDLVDAQYADADSAAAYAASYDGWGPSARYFRSRLYAVDEALSACRGGRLLDVGCGPGMFVRHLLDTRRGDFHVTACDRSKAMVDAVSGRVGADDGVDLVVASVEEMPFPDGDFDVVVAMGVLEYADMERGLSEVARVIRPGGVLVVTMLNPLSPYRMFEWCVYWPAVRVLGGIERLVGVPASRRHAARASGIRAVSRGRLRRRLRAVGLDPEDVLHYDLSPAVPPLDRIIRKWSRTWRTSPEKTVTRGARRWMGTAYLVVARRRNA